VEHVVDHVEHIASVAGPDAVGIGPDFVKELMDAEYPLDDHVIMEGLDAKAVLPGLEDPAGLPLVTEALLRRGFDKNQITAVLGGNTMRLFREHLGVPLADL
jgi:membrane dipeptidase